MYGQEALRNWFLLLRPQGQWRLTDPNCGGRQARWTSKETVLPQLKSSIRQGAQTLKPSVLGRIPPFSLKSLNGLAKVH